MKGLLFFAILAIAQLASARVPDGTYEGLGTWETRNASGVVVASGVLESKWIQDGLNGTNLGILKSGSTVVATFSDSYQLEEVTSSPEFFKLKRLIGGQMVVVGLHSDMGTSYTADFDQSGMQAIEGGNVVGDVLTRIGHLRASDGSITSYRVAAIKQ